MVKIIKNTFGDTVFDKLKEGIKSNCKLSVISAYFTIYAFSVLKKELENVDSIRFLLTEESYRKNSQLEYRQYYITRKIDNDIYGTEFELKLKNELEQINISKECADWIKSKVEFGVLNEPNISQDRMIVVENKNEGESFVIEGTDFTADGLGVSKSNRLGIVKCENDVSYTKHLINHFNGIWNDEDLVRKVGNEILDNIQYLYKENSAEFVYFFTLYYVFEKYLEDVEGEGSILNHKIRLKDCDIWNKLYNFQRDGVAGVVEKIEQYNGCIVADSVGLGKTFTALAVIKYYELKNYRVLVLCPKKLRENWIVYTKNDKRNIFLKDRFNFDVLNHTDLNRRKGFSGDLDLSMVNWDNYDLIVIDESHNFRNIGKKDDSRYKTLLNDVIKSGVKTKILMLTATPLNNRMNDIKNQISLITEENDSAFNNVGIKSVENTLKKAQQNFNEWAKQEPEFRTTENFLKNLDLDYFKLLDAITIARSRKYIEKYYDMKEIGRFPSKRKPVNVDIGIDKDEKFPELEEIYKEIGSLSLALYSPLNYVLPQFKEKYEKQYDTKLEGKNIVFKQEDREKQVINLIRINILKRLESSIYSFNKTLSKILDEINNYLSKVDNFIYPEINEEEFDITDEELNEIYIGKKVKVEIKDLDIARFQSKLKNDKIILEKMLKCSLDVDIKRDAKLCKLKETIKKKFDQPINGDNKKIIIFTAFADTAKYIYRNMSDWLLNNIGLYSACITGQQIMTNFDEIKDKSDLNTILTMFSPISKSRDKFYDKMKNEIDVIIATDCISEGQNLQDCDYLLNYDIHWNPVRIIQRFGRIDRIGSINPEIQLVNFWPFSDMDRYIKLKERVESRMIAGDISSAGDSQLIKEEERRDLEYRKNQLMKLRDSALNLEDIEGNISITDLNLNDFKTDLRNYVKLYENQIKLTPFGIFSVIDIDKFNNKDLEKGVIFTFKSRVKLTQQEKDNLFSPYFLVYVKEDGEMKYTYSDAKEVLHIFRQLCLGNNEIARIAMDKFYKDTNNAKNMKKYSILLQNSINKILNKQEKSFTENLFSRDISLYKGKNNNDDSLELISFLILQ